MTREIMQGFFIHTKSILLLLDYDLQSETEILWQEVHLNVNSLDISCPTNQI